MGVISAEKVKSLEVSCKELAEFDEVRHVGVINRLGNLVAGVQKKELIRY